MFVNIQETSAGVREFVTFIREEAEAYATYRTAIKTWLAAEYPAKSYEDYWDAMDSADEMTIKIAEP